MRVRLQTLGEKFGKNKLLLFIFLSVIFGIIGTIINNAGYGGGNQVEHLPVIIRLLDKTYLINDYFTNASMNSIARINYARFIAMLSGSERNLSFTFLFLSLCANILISVTTFSFAHKLFNDSPLAGIISSALVISIVTFELGYTSRIYSGYFEPATIAGALIFLAIWFVARGKCVISMVLCGLASIVHPLLGLEMGGVLLITYIVFQLISQGKISKNGFTQIFLSMVVLAGFSLFSVVPQFSQERIPTNLFIYLIAYFRNPHHYVPSTFKYYEFIYFIAYLIAMIIIYLKIKKDGTNPFSQTIAILCCVIVLLCIGGYVFVEIFPIRILVIAQTFRLLYFVKWIGLILFAGMIADEKYSPSTRLLYSAGILHPLAIGGVALSQVIRDWFERKQNWLSRVFHPLLILLAVGAIIYRYPVSSTLSVISKLGIFLVLILVFNFCPRKILHAFILASIILMGLSGIFQAYLPLINQIGQNVGNKYHLNSEIRSELGKEGNEVASFVKEHTPEGSIFLTPPMWGQFRILARRAIVIDFKAFLFDDIAMQEWYERLTNCYGYPEKAGFGMVDELELNYLNISDDRLLSLKDKYKISYAVLYKQTKTNLETIYQNNSYKVVFLGEK